MSNKDYRLKYRQETDKLWADSYFTDEYVEYLEKLLDNRPFCLACKEPDCLCSMDGTCAMIRRYLDARTNTK